MGAKFLDDAARRAFKHAIETIENASSAEVVVAMRQRSARYLHAHVIVGIAVAIGALATMLFASHEFGLTSILVDPFAVGIVAAILVEQVSPLIRVLTPRRWRQREVMRAARATFVERGVHNTAGRSGVLAYIGLLERECVLVPDSGLAAALPAEALARIAAAMTDAFPKGGSAVARALAELSPHAARAMPHESTDVNELPDVVDSDERGAS
jgi:putative membrane protein